MQIRSLNLKNFFLSISIFLVIDLIWLAIIAQPIYDHYLGNFLAESPRWWAAIVFYILFVVGLNYFVLTPALKIKSMKMAISNGAAFGFFTYMTYELTNYAVIEGWPLGIVPIDIAWGTILALIVTTTSYKILARSQ